jgi:hypothetical protein
MSPTNSQNRRSTPAIETDIISPIGIKQSRQQISSTDDHALAPPSNTSNIEAMLIKQSRQIRALYELQKSTFGKVSIIQTQVKKLTSTKNTDLSTKVFNVSKYNIPYRYITNY